MPKSVLERVEKGDDRRQILGVRVSSTDMRQVLKKIAEFVHSSHNSAAKIVVTLNPEFVMLAQKDPEFKEILNSADLSFADGHGLRLAEADLAIVPGRKVVQQLVTSGKYRIFYLGGRQGVAQAMAEKYGGMGDSGHENVRADLGKAEVNSRIIGRINAYKPDIVLVGYGGPWEEKWIWANREKVRSKVMMGVGGSFDFLTGRAALPPIWMENMGLEWLWRLIREPWRWKRQIALVQFAIRILLTKI